MATAKPKTAKAKTATKKVATKKKAASKSTTKSAPAKKTTAKKTTAKSPASKTTTKKATTKKTTATKKVAVKKASAKKETTKKKVVDKTSATESPKQTETKKAATKAKTATTKKKATKKTAAKKTAKSLAKNPVTDKETKKVERKKLNVGQKPPSGKSEAITKPTSFVQPERANNPITSGVVVASPESKEAKQSFKLNEKIVYPAHGVGKIVSIEKQEIAGVANELFLIVFDQEKMRLRVPTSKAASVGMRSLSDTKTIDKAIETLKGRARIKRTMWSRRAQEYEAKINSGNIIFVAEVVRDLFRSAEQPEQSYSERQLFEAAIDRLAREVAAVRNRGLESALGELEASLAQKKVAA